MATVMLSTLDSKGNLGFLYHLDEALASEGKEDYQRMIPVACFTIEQLENLDQEIINDHIEAMRKVKGG